MNTVKIIVRTVAASALIGIATSANAQGFEEWAKQQQAEQKEFIENERKSFEQFVKERDEEIRKMDEEFSKFLKQEWKDYDLKEDEHKPDTPKPVEKPVYQPEPVKTQPMQIDESEKIESCAETPRLPFLSKSDSEGFKASSVKINFYGNSLNVRYDPKMNQRIATVNEQSIGDLWDELSQTNYSSTVSDLLKWQNELSLNDWGFYMLTKDAAASIAGNQNSRVLLTWFLLTKANYKARLAYKGNNLYLLLAAANNIYGMPYFSFDNQRYYMVEGKTNNVYTYNHDFPEARTVADLNIYRPLSGNEQLRSRNIDFEYDGEKYQFNLKYDQNAISFYNDYPQADIKIYFDAAMGRAAKASLTEALMPVIGGMAQADAVELLLKFVQSFDYKTDDQQFGREKFFFPDEMLHYPYSDCEDRSVLFAYLVKQLVGLDVIGLNYPGHMATAVCFDGNVEGSYIEHNGRRYTVCDPTYIGAPVGLGMPQFAHVAAKVVENTATQPNLASRATKLWKVANKYGLHQGDNKHNIAFDSHGDAYMCGYFSGDVDFMGRQLSSAGSDIFIAKITADNSLDFLYRIGSNADDMAYNIVLNGNDGFYFSGSFNGDMTVAGQKLRTTTGDFFIAKCSPEGKLAWINQANIGQMDSINNTFAAQFDKSGKRLWTRTYAESEDMTDYGIHIDEAGNPFLTGSLLASVGMFNKSYESMVDDLAAIEAEAPTAPAIAGLLTIVSQALSTNSLPGKTMQLDLSNSNPEFSNQSPDLYKQFGNIELIRNGMGIVTVRTNNREPVVLNTVKLDNNSKLKISVYNTGNAMIEFLSGSEYGNEQTWRPLNSLKLYRTSGNLTFDYDTDHTRVTVNAGDVF